MASLHTVTIDEHRGRADCGCGRWWKTTGTGMRDVLQSLADAHLANERQRAAP
jgi:hypothetical protein